MKKSKWLTVLLFALLLLGGAVSAQALSSGEETPSEDRTRDREPILPRNSLNLSQPDIGVDQRAAVPVPERPATVPPLRHLWGDCDGDGLKDLFVLHHKGNLVYQNRGSGGFKDVTAIAFPNGAGQGGAGFFGDYNGDGRDDLFLYLEKGFVLYRNDGDLRFTDVTETLGLPAELLSTQAHLEDYDGDGFDDLLVQTPGGDRIFRNRSGQGFDSVRLEGLDLDGAMNGNNTPTPDLSKPGRFSFGRQLDYNANGPVGADPYQPPALVYDSVYINDNSPGSVGIDVPEVEGGDDTTTQNDIVDGTIVAADLQLPLSLTCDSSDPVMMCKNPGSDSGVYGEARRYGVIGQALGFPSLTSYGVYGENAGLLGAGVRGYASRTTGDVRGVYGKTESPDGCGVLGRGPGIGLRGEATGSSTYSYGVYGEADHEKGRGVIGYATSTTGYTRGVYGKVESDQGRAVWGHAASPTGVTYGVMGTVESPDGWGGWFSGGCSTDVLEIRGGSDLSECFDIRGARNEPSPAPGMVVCIDPEHPGNLVVSTSAYDRTVAGIISGAGGIDTGLLMGQDNSKADGETPVALTGRVYCWVDASQGAVEPGDLLTSSDVPGYAMKVLDHVRSQGAIIGKAMTSLKKGKGLVLVLVALQ